MFIGHYSVALAAATSRKAPGLGALFVAAQLVDIAFFAFLLIGVEHMRLVPGITASNPMDLYDMPWTHSLLGAVGWGAAFALVVRLAGGGWAASAIGAGTVVSHWLLDLLVHRPDLTLAGSPPRLGLGLWNLPAVERPLELVLAFGTLWLFVRATRPLVGMGRWSWMVLAAAMLLLQAVNWFGPKPVTTVDPAPPSESGLALFAYLLLARLAWWVGRTRALRP